MNRVTLRDVAARAGVSVTTASHVLNEVPGKRILAATRDRVQAAAVELDYRPNRLAQGLRLQRSYTLGLMSDQIATSPHAGQTILGAQDAAAEHGLVLLVTNSNNDPAVEDRQLKTLLDRQVDGIVYAREHHEVLGPIPALDGVQHVLLDARPAAEGCSWVVPDEIRGVEDALAELHRYGHRRIGYVQCMCDLPATHLRLQGFRQVLDASGDFDPDLVVADTTDAPGGFRAAHAILDRPASRRPTALFCFNDRMAMGAYQAVAELGLVVGRDVSIVGFDNQELIAANLRPGLTTLALPHYGMGRWAVEQLLRSIDAGGEVEPETKLMPCPLVRRASVGAPPGE